MRQHKTKLVVRSPRRAVICAASLALAADRRTVVAIDNAGVVRGTDEAKKAKVRERTLVGGRLASLSGTAFLDDSQVVGGPHTSSRDERRRGTRNKMTDEILPRGRKKQKTRSYDRLTRNHSEPYTQNAGPKWSSFLPARPSVRVVSCCLPWTCVGRESESCNLRRGWTWVCFQRLVMPVASDEKSQRG